MNNSNNNQTSGSNSQYSVFFICFIFIILTVFLFYRPFLSSVICNVDDEILGLFGDSFGALNTLFSGCAFAGVAITLFIQQEQIKLYREELKDSEINQQKQLDHFTKHADHLEQQAKLLKIQSDIQQEQLKILKNQHNNQLLTSYTEIKKHFYEIGKEVSVLKEKHNNGEVLNERYLEFMTDYSTKLKNIIEVVDQKHDIVIEELKRGLNNDKT